MHSAAYTKMLKARIELVLEHPFFASLALRLTFQEDSTCKTAWADGTTLGFNAAFIDMLPLEKVKGLLCHEVLHLACCHHTRRGLRDQKLWNTACDYAINPVLLEAGVELPHGYLDDPKYHGKNAETIYAALKNYNEEYKGGATGGAEQDAEAGDDVDAGGTGDGVKESEEQSSSSESEDSSTAEGENDVGGSEGEENSDQDESSDSNDPGMSGEVRDASEGADGSNNSEKEHQEDSWNTALTQAIHKAMEFGSLPGSLERLFTNVISPNLDWKELLRQFISNAAKSDFSWTHPNRRYLHSGLYLPGLHSEELPEVAVVIDVSGSITQLELDTFCAELSSILEEFDTTVHAITCDTKITSYEQLRRWDLPLNITASGGGGTSFRPPFAKLADEDVQPACLVYLSDMQCNLYPEEPDYPVLWVSTTTQYNEPPFGDVLILE